MVTWFLNVGHSYWPEQWEIRRHVLAVPLAVPGFRISIFTVISPTTINNHLKSTRKLHFLTSQNYCHHVWRRYLSGCSGSIFPAHRW